MPKRGLSDAQVERVLHALGRRLRSTHNDNLSSLAAELGIAQPSLWQVVNRRTRPSYGTAETLARLEGVPVESILASPRDRAAAIAREGGVLEEAVRKVLGEPEPGDQRPVLWWVDRMRLTEQSLRYEAPASTRTPKLGAA